MNKLDQILAVISTIICSILFASNVQAQNYCAASSNYSNFEWISKVSVNGAANESAGQGYSDFTQIIFNLPAGSTASLELHPGFSSTSFTENWKVWIDWNNNGSFSDVGEEVFSAESKSSVSGSFSIPAGIQGHRRMRVAMSYTLPIGPCGSFIFGEVEDYTVNLVEGSSTDSLAIVGSSRIIQGSFPQPTTFEINSDIELELPMSSVPIQEANPHYLADSKELAYFATGPLDNSLYGTYLSRFNTKTQEWSHVLVNGITPLHDAEFASTKTHLFFASVRFDSNRGVGGVHRFNRENEQIDASLLSDRDISNVILGDDGFLYASALGFGSSVQTVFKINLETFTVEQAIPIEINTSIYNLFVDASGALHVAYNTPEVGAGLPLRLAKFNANGSLNTIHNLSEQLPPNTYTYASDLDFCFGRFVIGTVEGKLVTTSADGTNTALVDTPSDTIVFTTCMSAESAPAVEYCEAKGTNTSYEWIQRVEFVSWHEPAFLTQQSGSNNGYGDYSTGTQKLLLAPGFGADFNLQPGFRSGSSYTEQWKVFVDFNADGEFTSNEQVVDASSNTTVSGSFSVPLNATLGTTRMRVLMQYGASPQACGVYTWGEVEDYTVEIVTPPHQ